MSQSYTLITIKDLNLEAGTLEDSVVGLSFLKELIEKINQLNASIDAATAKGITRPKGIIFNGPPGTGKTLVAKYAAKALGYDYMYVSSASLQSPMPAITIKKIEKIFKHAANQINCVLFIDEIDALIKDRATGGGDAGGALQKFLEMLDGSDNKDRAGHLLVIVATNHIEHLDKAFVRPGRFDEKIYFSLPGATERETFITKFISENVDVSTFVDLTDGFSYAELNAFINKAVTTAFLSNASINEEIMITAAQSVLSGSSSNEVVEDQSIRLHLIPHLAGHTLAYIFNPNSFVLGTSTETAELLCSPKINFKRIVSRKEKILQVLSILWAQTLEIKHAGDASSLSIVDQQKLETLLDDILLLFGAAQSVNLNLKKLKTMLASTILGFINNISNMEIIIKLEEATMNHYTQHSVLTRKKFKSILSETGLTQASANALYNSLVNLIEGKLGLDMNNIGLSKKAKLLKAEKNKTNKQVNQKNKNVVNENKNVVNENKNVINENTE